MEVFSGIILLLSGVGAGLITGLIGASAATFMAGILISVLGYGAYLAIGVSLVTDVFASLVSAHLYKKAKNIDLKRALLIGSFAVGSAFIGSVVARLIPDLALGDGLGIFILITGITFLGNPTQIKKTKLVIYFENKKILASILIGTVLGFFSGIFGAGGGIGILVALVFILGFPIKRAVGTAVLIMAFISLSGGIGHFVGKEIPFMVLAITSLGGIIGAIFSSKFVNKISEEKMFKISGVILILISLVVIFKKFFHLPGILLG